MKKHKMKILLSGILALLLVGCSGADKGGGGTGGDIVQPEKVVIETKEKTLEAFIKLEEEAISSNEANTSEERFNVSVPIISTVSGMPMGVEYTDSEMDGVVIKPDVKDGQPKRIVSEFDGKSAILIEKNVHLEFKDPASDPANHIINKGNIYFVGEDEEKYEIGEPGEPIHTEVTNYGKIYLIGETNKPKKLTIAGSYLAKGEDAKIYLGLYVDKEKKIHTDQLIIGGLASGKTKIHFVFDKDKIDKEEEFKADQKGMVIFSTLVKHSDGDSIFSVAGGTVPVGKHTYELKYQPGGVFVQLDQGAYSMVNYWYLKEKK